MAVFMVSNTSTARKAANSIFPSVAVHNWLKKYEDLQMVYGKLYCPSGYVNYEDAHEISHKGTWRSEVSESGALQELTMVGPNNCGKRADYYRMFMAESELSRQFQYVRRTAYESIL